MPRRSFLFALPWLLVVVAAPEFLWNVYSLRLLAGFGDASIVFLFSATVVYLAPVVGIALILLGLVKRFRPIALHGGVTFILSAVVLVYANSIPPKRFYAAGLVKLDTAEVELRTV